MGGTLSITNPTLSLADTSNVIMSSLANLNLNFAGEDTVRSLYVDGVGQLSGTWGSLTSTATNKRPFFTGDGVINVSTAATTSLLGDYSNNGTVDAADFVIWRDNNGRQPCCRTIPFLGLIGQVQYDLWRENFGES